MGEVSDVRRDLETHIEWNDPRFIRLMPGRVEKLEDYLKSTKDYSSRERIPDDVMRIYYNVLETIGRIKQDPRYKGLSYNIRTPEQRSEDMRRTNEAFRKDFT